jgi:hypothetical protein
VDDHHVDLAALDRLDQLAEPVAGDLLERRVPVILEPRATSQPRLAACASPRSSWVGTDSAAS